MKTVAVAIREGVRLVRASLGRSAVVGITIATATSIGVLRYSVAFGCWALSLAVLVVARRSARPERIESAYAWARIGGNRFSIWLSGTVEALILGWVPTLAGVAVGTILRQATGPDRAAGSIGAFVGWQLGALTLAACLPTTRAQRTQNAIARQIARAGRGVREVVVGIALIVTFQLATNIRTDFDLAISGLLIVFLLSIVGLIVTGPVPSLVTKELGRISGFRALTAIAARHRAPGTVRLIVVVALTVATAAAILGASVQARPDTAHAVDEQLARLPVLPYNAALVRLEASGLAVLDPSRIRPAFDPARLQELRGALTRAVPGAELIELRDLGADASASSSLCNCRGPLVLADPRLRSIYGADAKFPAPKDQPLDYFAHGLAKHAATRVPTSYAGFDRRHLPPASFFDVTYYEVPKVYAVGRPTTVRAVFVRSPARLTDSQLARLQQLARSFPVADGTAVALVGPKGRLVPAAISPYPMSVRSSLREAPWAATSAASRWSVTLAAGLFALIALLVTLTIDTLDRRHDVRRLERIGATPGQVRGAAALHAAVLFVVVTWLSVAVVVVLVAAGTHAFNHAESDIPVPFTMPWAVVSVLAIGLPVVAAALSALVARPVHLATSEAR